MRQVDARVPILQLESLAQANERLLVSENTLARATAILGLIALFLATWGLYGVLSYIVTLRSREIAVLRATDAHVVLLDEPMAGVGSGDVAGLSDTIRQMHREQGCTILMVEHHMEVLLGLVEKVAVMYFGTVLAFDTPEAVMNNPTVQSAYLGTSA